MDIETKGTMKEVSQVSGETERTRNRKVYIPKVDIYETKTSIVLIADMPGVDEKTVDISLEKNILTIKGSVAATNLEGYDLVYTEYATGDYQRAFSISDEVDKDRIEATVKDGVLKITLYKVEQAKAKKIAILAEK
ncbi:MAG: Spore protein SP21 [Syntrophus sp. SKADARSKE-3]|nr:Spore protein SP21 [Syntrophus sp. SKADARSKE-3]